MTNPIVCPNCSTEIQISEVTESQLSAQIRAELEGELTTARSEIAASKRKLEQERGALKQAEKSVADRMESGIAAQRSQLIAEAKQKAKEDLAVELRDRDERVGELQ